jgi:hypothetical protein
MTVPISGQPISQSLVGSAAGGLGEIRLVGDVSYGQVGQAKKFSIDTNGKAGDCNVIVTG